MKKLHAFLMQCIATWFFSGKSKIAPGTVGSLCTLPVIYFLYPFGVGALLAFALASFFVGWIATDYVIKTTRIQDPGFVVIDEVVGQTLAFVGVALYYPLNWWILGLGFLLFRLFDIKKMGLVAFFDKKVHNAFGVMMDDVIAGIYATVILTIICIICI